MPELTEPGWPKLDAGDNPGEIFVNAFAKAAQVNNQKHALEQQIAALNYKMQKDTQDAAFDREKFEWTKMYQTGEQARRMDALGIQAYYADQRNQRQSEVFELTTARKAMQEEKAGELQAELTEAASTHPVGSQDFQNKLALIKDKYASIIPTPAGDRVLRHFDAEQNSAAMQSHRTANDLRKNFDSSLQMSGQGFDRQDFLQPESVWGKDKKGNRFIAEYPTQVGNQVQWNTIPVSDLSSLSEADQQKKYPGLKFKTMPEKTYQNLREMHNRILAIGGPDLSEKPAVIEGNRENRARMALSDPDATEAEKAAARRILGQ